MIIISDGIYIYIVHTIYIVYTLSVEYIYIYMCTTCNVYYIIYYMFFLISCLLGGRVMKRGGRRLPIETTAPAQRDKSSVR